MSQPSMLHPNRFLLLLVLFLLGSAPVQAQGEPTFESLLVEIWPEFDRAETLVIYRGQLSAETPLPATLSFVLPGYVEELNAVAYAEGGSLIAVPTDEIEQTYLDDQLRLTFTTASTAIQLEYYDSQILSRKGDDRTVNYDFQAPYAIGVVTFEFQAPIRSQDFRLQPAATETFTDTNAFTYYTYNVANLAEGDTAAFQASYRRLTNQLSVEFLMTDPLPEQTEASLPALPVSTTPPPTTEHNQIFAYLLASIGTCLLLGVGVVWWFERRRPVSGDEQTASRPPRSATQRGGPGVAARSQASSAKFCFTCGTELRPEANFCHSCGSPRRV